MTQEANLPPCRVFICYWGDILVGFGAMLLLPNGDIRDFWMGHRLVVLPDYQGMGIGTRLNEFCGEIMLNDGQKYYCKTAHFKLKNYYKTHKTWTVMKEEIKRYTKGCESLKTNLPKGVDPYKVTYPFKIYDSLNGSGKNMSKWINRSLISARYLGKDYINKPHKIIVVESDLDRKGLVDNLIKLVDKEHYYNEVVCGSTRNEDELCQACHEVGVQSYPFEYKNNLHVHNILNGKFDGMNDDTEIVYIYDDKHKSFLNEFEKINVKIIKINDDETKKDLFDL